MTIELICGVDEVGRGPLAGAVVTAAVILNPADPIVGLNDSKKLSEKKREKLSEEIKARALCWALGRAEATEIDDINILQASLLAMKRAVVALSMMPTKALIDGNRCPQGLPCASEAHIGGDGLFDCISAASILAKVARDREMVALSEVYPQYGFAGHKGYPTKAHMQALQTYGVSPIHRRSFKPVAACLV